MDTLYTFWDTITHYKTESVYFLGTKLFRQVVRTVSSCETLKGSVSAQKAEPLRVWAVYLEGQGT